MGRSRFTDKDQKKLYIAFHSRESTPLQFGDRDRRTFGEILGDWAIALDDNGLRTETFLKKTALDKVLTPDQWDGLVQGRLAASKKLSGILYVLMCDSIKKYGHTEQQLLIPAFDAYMYKSKYIRDRETAQGREQNIIGISDEMHRALRRPLLQELHDQIFPLIASAAQKGKKDTPADQPLLVVEPHPVLTTIAEILGRTPEGTLNHLADAYRKSADDTLEALEANCTAIPSEEIMAWANRTLKPLTQQRPHIGQMHKVLRQSQGDFIHQYDNKYFTQSNHGNIQHNWEQLGFRPSAHFLPILKKCFEMDEEEYQLLKEARLPQFNKTWLDAQPEKLRTRYYVHALMADKGVALHTAKKLHYSHSPSTLETIVKMLDCTQAEQAQFKYYAKAHVTVSVVELAKAQEKARLLLADPEGYFSAHNIPVKMRIGNALTLCADAADISFRHIAKHMRRNESLLCNIRKGLCNLTMENAEKAAELFHICDRTHTWFDKQSFMAICRDNQLTKQLRPRISSIQSGALLPGAECGPVSEQALSPER